MMSNRLYAEQKAEPEMPAHIFLFFMYSFFKRFCNIFGMYFYFTYQNSSTSSYDKTTKTLFVSSYELANICQASIIDFSIQCKKHK